MPFTDFREFLAELERNNLLRHCTREVDKDWEISVVTRWVYHGFPEERRFALLFDKVKGFEIPVVVGALGASYKTYAIACGITPSSDSRGTINKIRKKWDDALNHPLEPRIVSSGPCKENILKGDKINIHKFPIPIWTPEKDGGLGMITAPCHITKDPTTGVRNVGTYRSMVRKEKDQISVFANQGSHAYTHIRTNDAQGRLTEIATVIGADPTIGLASATRIPYGLDEMSIAGGLRGEPIELVKCETVNIEVPASAEIVIEGKIRPSKERPYEEEGPFGEYTGYQGSGTYSPVIEITCITHRNQPIYQAFVSQVPPSESSKIRQIGYEGVAMRTFKSLGIRGVVDIHMPEAGQALISIVALRKEFKGHVGQVANALCVVLRWAPKFIIVVDEDIDIDDMNSVLWALAFRCSLIPERKNVWFIEGNRPPGLDYSAAESMDSEVTGGNVISTVVMDATRPYVPYPEVSLPYPKYWEKAKQLWENYGLPSLESEKVPKCVLFEEEYLKKGIVAKPPRFMVY